MSFLRLDAGSFGTMGVGLGFAIAAALYAKDYQPDSRVLCVQGKNLLLDDFIQKYFLLLKQNLYERNV